MECSGGRRDRPILAREHGLIVLAVGFVGRTARGDVWRKRHPAGALEQDFDSLISMEVKQGFPFFLPFPCGRSYVSAELYEVPISHPLRVADERPPFPRPFPLVQRSADARFAASSFQLRRNHARVVEYEHIASAKERRKVETRS